MANSNGNFDVNLNRSNFGRVLYSLSTEQLVSRYFIKGEKQSDLYAEMLPKAGKLNENNQYVYQTLASLSADNLCCLFTTIDKLSGYLPDNYALNTDAVIRDINLLLNEYKDYALDAAFGDRTPFTISFSKHFAEDLLVPAVKRLREKVAGTTYNV